MKAIKLAIAVVAFLVTATLWPPPRAADASRPMKCYEQRSN